MTTERTEELKPCPFNCGHSLVPAPSASFMGTAKELGTKRDRWEHQVRCCCGASGPTKDTRAEAITAWNTRSLTPQAPADDVVERVAKIIYDGDPLIQFWDRPGGPPGNGYIAWERLEEPFREKARKQARAAIAAIPPSEVERLNQLALDGVNMGVATGIELCAEWLTKNITRLAEHNVKGVATTMIAEVRDGKPAALGSHNG